MDEIFKVILSGLRNLLILVLSCGFLGIGMLKLVEYPAIADVFSNWGVPIWARYLIGIIEIVLAVGIFYRPTRIKSSLGVILLMLGAISVHLYFNEIENLIPPILILLGALILYLIQKKEY